MDAKKRKEKGLMDPDNIPAFLEGRQENKSGTFGFGGRRSGRIGGGQGRTTNAVKPKRH
jgi:hypothetical protein